MGLYFLGYKNSNFLGPYKEVEPESDAKPRPFSKLLAQFLKKWLGLGSNLSLSTAWFHVVSFGSSYYEVLCQGGFIMYTGAKVLYIVQVHYRMGTGNFGVFLPHFIL